MPKGVYKRKHKRISDDYLYEIDKRTGCWNYIFSVFPAGYGIYYVKYQNKIGKMDYKPICAHRYFYEKYKGVIPKKLQIDHLCRNRRCVNPEHLEAVTCAENIRRGSLTKLTWEEIKKIRGLLKRKVPQRKIAKKFNVGQQNISAIKTGRSWILNPKKKK